MTQTKMIDIEQIKEAVYAKQREIESLKKNLEQETRKYHALKMMFDAYYPQHEDGKEVGSFFGSDGAKSLRAQLGLSQADIAALIKDAGCESKIPTICAYISRFEAGKLDYPKIRKGHIKDYFDWLASRGWHPEITKPPHPPHPKSTK